MSITWGISALTHDASISVIDGENILFAAHAERYSKIKNDPHLNQQIINAALEYGQPDDIVWFENRWLKKWRQFKHGQWKYLFNQDRWPQKYLNQFGIKKTVHAVNHHLSHAASGFLTSPFDDACILCIDSLGEDQTITIWHGCGTTIDLIHEIKYPHSLGLLYTAFTQRCGLKPNEEEYILMGMSAYGQPVFQRDIIDEFIKEKSFALRKNLHKGIGNWKPNAVLEDLAASIQLVFEECLCEIISQYCLFSKHLVFSGGAALNCVANRHLNKHFDNVWIMPNPGDAGSSLGCAAYFAQTRLKWEHPYLGTIIPGEYPVEQCLHALLADGIVGVANGGAEFGPRSLGNRSLLADPRPKDMKDRVNVIKKRQKFRPFAPVILEEFANDFFYLGALKSSPYMQYTVACRFDKFPAIVHVDGMSRLQTVNRKQNAGLYDLIKAFYEKTGCPMLLNTSLNIRGMPIVNDKSDAIMFKNMYGVSVF